VAQLKLKSFGDCHFWIRIYSSEWTDLKSFFRNV